MMFQKGCSDLHDLDPRDRCNFTKQMKCDDGSNFILYHYFMFCVIPEPSFDNTIFLSAILLMVIWLIVLFLIVSTAAEEFFCPSLGIISKALNLSENVAGVTLVVFGNGTTYIVNSLFHPDGDTVLMYNWLMGSVMFITCVVAGYIVIIKPFKVQPYQFLRDVLFLLVSILWLVHTIQDEVICLYESISYLLIYILYIGSVIGGHLINNKIKAFFRVDEKPAAWETLRAKTRVNLRQIRMLDRRFTSFLDINLDESSDSSSSSQEIDENMEIPSGKVVFREMCTEMWERLKPIHAEQWKRLTLFDKCSLTIKSPIILLLRIFIPVIDIGENKNGWSKLLNSIQCVSFPIFVIFTLECTNKLIFGISILVPITLLGIFAAVFVFYRTTFDAAPKYHNVYAVMGYIGATTTMYYVIDEIIVLLDLFVTLMRIDIATFGITVLAWVISIGDVIANISIARQGFQKTAFAACFGRSLANTLLGMGLSFLVRDLNSPVYCSHAGIGVMGPVCSTFLLINICYSIFYVLLIDFKTRRSYGVFLLLIYFEFLLFCFLCETGVVHPLGTDHEFDTTSYEDYIKKHF